MSLFSVSITLAQEDDFNVELNDDTKKTAIGGFGAELAKKVSFVNFNGYITNEYFVPQNGVKTFDNHYFNVFVSSQLNNRIFIEGQLEYEHGGEEVELRYAFADYKIEDYLVIRSGKFLVPAGQFNEYIYPEYLSKTVNRPFVNREISPSAWAEVGIQIRGRFTSNESLTPFYSLYMVNGLSGDSGSGIRGLRGNSRDSQTGNDNTSFGGSFGLDVGKDITVSTNYYTGKYTSDGELNLSIFGASFYLDKPNYSIWSEVHTANQESYFDIMDPALGNQTLNKLGYYVQGGYMITSKIETIARFDSIDLDGAADDDRSRFTLGLNYLLATTAIVKVNYEFVSDDGTNADDNLLGFQLSIGF